MAVKLNSTGGGSVTLDSPSTASNYTVTLPSAAGTLATTTGTGSVFTNPTINGFTGDTSAITIGTTQFVKDASGNVGIGTATPGAKLEVYVGNGTLDATGLILNNAYNNYATSYNGSTSIIAKGYSYQGFAQTTIGQIQFALDNGFDSGWGSSIRFYTSSTRGSVAERMRLDSSGNLGLGVTPNSGWASSKALQIGSSVAPYMALAQMTVGTADGYMLWGAYLTGNRTFAYTMTGDVPAAYRQVAGTHAWFNAPSGTAGNAISFTQAMTLDASGNFFLGTTSYLNTNCRANIQQDSNNAVLTIYCSNASLSSAAFVVTVARNTTNGSHKPIVYYNSGAAADRFYVIDSGAIYSTSTSITGISDVRHKENIRDLDTGLSAVLALKPRRFDWKEGKGIDRKDQPGFIAQEVEKVLPELIELWTESQEDKNEYKGIRLADMIPTLVKAIQELSAQNNALEARLAKLEAK